MVKKIELRKPPVMEVVIGAQFDGPVFENMFIYDFYQEIKSSFPNITENLPIPSIIVHPTKPDKTRVLQGFNSRRLFINNNGDKLIQLQSDRLLFNWRKNSEDDEYPRFTQVLNEFLEVYDKIKIKSDFTEKIDQLEITFVDHIFLKDFGLQTFNLNEIFNDLSFPQGLKSIESKFTIPEEVINGTLTLKIQSALNIKDQNKVIVCETTCRGKKEDGEKVLDWYHRAHEILLDFFIDLFSEKSKIIWGG